MPAKYFLKKRKGKGTIKRDVSKKITSSTRLGHVIIIGRNGKSGLTGTSHLAQRQSTSAFL
jgi:hypothetical protein